MGACGIMETPCHRQDLTDTAIRYECEYDDYQRFESLTITLKIHTAAAAGGDTLVVQPQSRPSPIHEWYNLGSPFTTVLGTAGDDDQQTLNYHKQNIGWSGEISFLCTPAGGTADFNITIVIEGN